VYINIAVHT